MRASGSQGSPRVCRLGTASFRKQSGLSGMQYSAPTALGTRGSDLVSRWSKSRSVPPCWERMAQRRKPETCAG